MAIYFNNPFFSISNHEVYLDVGAYDGDTIRDFIDTTKGQFNKIMAIEPEKKSFAKLRAYVQSTGMKNIEIYDNGCWNENGNLKLELNEESSGISNQGTESIVVKRIDDQFAKEDITLIKINFLYGVTETLSGAKNVLKNLKPNLAITVGFDEWGLIKIPQIIKSLNPDYKLHLRYASPMPARLILFAH